MWDDRYELVDKRVYCDMPQMKIPFWEGASLEWGKQYALEGSSWRAVMDTQRGRGVMRCSS